MIAINVDQIKEESSEMGFRLVTPLRTHKFSSAIWKELNM